MTAIIVAFAVIVILLRIKLKRYLREAAFDIRGRAIVFGRVIAYPDKGSLCLSKCDSSEEADKSVIQLRTGLGYNIVKSYQELLCMGIEVKDFYDFVDKKVREYRICNIRLDTLSVLLCCQAELKSRITEISKGKMILSDNILRRIKIRNNKLRGSAAIEFEKLNKQYHEILKKTI